MTAPMSEKEALSLIDALTGHAITQTKEFEKLLNQAVADIHDASLETDERFKDYKEKNALLKFLRRSLKLIQD